MGAFFTCIYLYKGNIVEFARRHGDYKWNEILTWRDKDIKKPNILIGRCEKGISVKKTNPKRYLRLYHNEKELNVFVVNIKN